MIYAEETNVEVLVDNRSGSFMKNGPILNHGQTIGIDSETQFRLSLEPHPASSAPTMMLMLEHTSKHKLNESEER